jgi:hypothetical protein
MGEGAEAGSWAGGKRAFTTTLVHARVDQRVQASRFCPNLAE